MENTPKKENWFVRSLIIGFCLLIVAMIGFNYFWIDPKGEINSGIVTLLTILLVLVLSESFDNFSIGKLVSISREAQKKEKQVQKLEKEKSELINQMITISTSQTQSQQHTNVYGDYNASRVATVERASEQELQARETEKEEPTAELSKKEYKIDWRKVGSIGLDKFINGKSVHASNVIAEAKLVTQFHGIDPINNYQPIFDGYYKDDDKEIFIELRPNHNVQIMLREKIYMMLSKLNHYQEVKKVNAHLELVWLNVPDEEPKLRTMERFMQDFEPAIASGLLRISEINLSSEDMNKCKREV